MFYTKILRRGPNLKLRGTVLDFVDREEQYYNPHPNENFQKKMFSGARGAGHESHDCAVVM